MELLATRVADILSWVILAIELFSAGLIIYGVARTIYQAFDRRLLFGEEGYRKSRRTLGNFLALALEFQLAADILHTAIRPSWEQIGELAAIAAIRTFLNYFLDREMSAMDAPSTGEETRHAA